MPSNITTWLKFALQQMAAESYLDGLNLQNEDLVRLRLSDGNNDTRVIQPDPVTGELPGKTRFTNVLADRFLTTYDILNHHANDATGFSATLMRDTTTGEYTLSFRSTESRPAAEGGDRERDFFGADVEVGTTGFAFGQLAAMEEYYQSLKASGILPSGAVLNITGYSLGGHLATVFTELHEADVNHTYLFNAAGRGHVPGAVPDLAAEESRISDMLTYFRSVLDNPDNALDSVPHGTTYEQAKALYDQQGTSWHPFDPGAPSLYSDPRYQWAKTATLALFNPSGLLLLQTPGEVQEQGPFAKITQLYGQATTDDLQFVANAGVHAPAIPVFIEGQPLIAGAPFPSWTESGNTHSITLLVDSLAVQELIQTIDSTYGQAGAELLIKASSNSKAQTLAPLDTLNVVEGDSLEKTVDALRNLFRDPALPPAEPLPVNSRVGGFGDLGNRNQMYAAIQEVQDRVGLIQAQGVVFTLDDLTDPTLGHATLLTIADADTPEGLAYRYALTELNPFAVIANTPQANAALYAAHNIQGQLDRFNEANGTGTLTTQYFDDRILFLKEKIALNQLDEEKSPGTIHFVDAASNYEIHPVSILTIDQEYYFGREESDAFTGNSAADHLFGGGGVDALNGSGGNDYLQGDGGHDRLDGGTGSDTLHGGRGIDLYVLNLDGLDTIRDGDGLGAVYLNDQLIVGGLRRPGEPDAPYTSLDGQFTFVQSGSTLTISNSLTIQNWQPGELGITLRDLSGLHDGAPPTINYANGQPTITYDGDATDNTPIFTAAANHIARGFGGNDILDFSSGSALYDHQVFGGDGHDELHGGAGQDRIFGETGRDLMSGGLGDDVLDGGADIDLLKGGIGQDALYGGTGNDGLDGGAGDDILFGGANDDVLSGESIELGATTTGNDYLAGEAGADWLLGLRGDDVLMGGEHNDRLYGDQAPVDVPNLVLTYPGVVSFASHAGFFSQSGGNDYLDGGAGEDYLQGDAGDDVLVGGSENDTLYGDDPTIDGVESGKDLLDGGSGDDFLFGGGEADSLFGGAGNDTLFGDFLDDPTGGNDLLDGGAGNDTLFGGRGDDILFGGADRDVLMGNEGQDVLDGGSGADQLFGGSEDDVLWGGTENDQLFGEDGNDTLFGGEGNDTLIGGDGDDVLVGGPGTDILIGGAGADTYVFNLGDGIETIQDAAGEGNRVVFGPGIHQDDISVGIGSLVVRVGVTGDAIHIQGFDPANPTVPVGIETFEFADGTTLTQADLVARGFDLIGTAGHDTLNGGQIFRTIYGLDGNDFLTGGDIDNVLDGGNGNDVIFGNGGSDLLSGGTGDDILRGGEGNDTLTGDAGNDSLEGEAGDDVLVGGTGDDQLLGGAGADTYWFNLGDGIDSISDSNSLGEESRVVFGTGITSSSITLTTTFGQVLVRPGATLDGLTIGANGSDVLGPRAVDRFEFTDGTSITYAELVARGFEIDGTMGDDFLFGTNVVDRFRGGIGNDRLEGGAGSDLYFFNAGDGVDTILDSAAAGAGNEVVFGAGITSADIRLDLAPDQSDSNRSDLLIHVGTSGDAMQLDTFDRTNVAGPRTVETFRFADGSTLTYEQLLARGFDLTGTDGDDQITGTNVMDRLVGGAGDDVLRSGLGDDTLDGGLGNDRLLGGQGNDTYVFGPGSGHDTIVEFQGSLDRIQMAAGVSPSDVAVTRNNNDLVFSLNGGADRLTVSLYFLAAPLQIEQVQFADGTVWDQVFIDDLVQPTITGTGGSDVLVGTSNNDRLAGLAGDDQLTGLAGNDLLDGGTGADHLTGGAGDDTYIVDDAGDVITELANEGVDTVQSSVTTTLASNVERLTLTGTAPINGIGNELDNVLMGNDGANVLTGGTGNDTYVVGAGDSVVELAGEGTDTLQSGVSATLGANVEHLTLTGSASLTGMGNALDNVLQADGSVSILLGGDGNDTYLIGPNGDDDVLVETTAGGIDTVIAAHEYRLPANIENLTLLDPRVPDFATVSLFPYGSTGSSVTGYGNDLDNTLIGGRANNVLDGGLGADTMRGGAGDDTYIVDNIGDMVIEQANEGIDTIHSSVTYTLSQNVENLTLVGAMPVNGTGNALNNVLRGNDAPNTLDGGSGDDSLQGFGGADTYLFGRGSGRDMVFDVSTAGEIDTIQLDSTMAAEDVEVYRNGFHLELVIEGTSDEITLLSFFDSPGYDQKEVRFADGTVWSSAELHARAVVGSVLTGSFENDTIVGSDGHDVLIGSAGDDVLMGGGGKDVLYGDLTFQSPSGNQIIGNDTLLGGAGDDTLIDFRGTNLFDGGVGNDTLVLGTGVDTVLFGRGSGSDSVTLDNNRNDIDIIEMAPGITPADVAMTWRSASRADLVVADSGDSLTVQLSTDWFAVGPDTTQAIVRFGDGTEWSLAWSSSNVDVPAATASDDLLDAPFPATVAGLGGDDTYLFGSSGVPGSYAVTEEPGGGIDTVQSLFDYVLDAHVEHLILAESTSSVLPNPERGTGNELDNLLIGNTGDNILVGGAGNDVLVGGIFRQLEGPPYVMGTGSDILIGGEGDDVLMADAGNVMISASSMGGWLFLDGGLDFREEVPREADDLMIGGPGNDTYILHIQEQTVVELPGEGTDTVLATVNYVLGDQVENLTLLENVVSLLPGPVTGTGNDLDNVLIGNSEDNVLSGGAGRDTLWGGSGVYRDSESIRSGHDILIGGTGDDTYLFNMGDGVDTIQDVAAVGEGNRIQFGAGITQSDLTFAHDQAACTLTIQVGSGSTDQLVLTNFDPTGANGSLVVETVAFADGSSASLANLLSPGPITGTAGDDMLYGTTGDDTIIGGTGNDTLNGGSGDDTYMFNLGDGVDTITDISLPGEGNTLEFGPGLTPDDLSLGVGSLLIRVGTTGDAIHLTNFDPDNVLGPRTIETFRFADQTVLSYEQLVARGFDLTGTAGHDTIIGTNAADRISGLAGNDTLQGGAGNDWLDGGQGADIMIGGPGDDTYVVNVAGDVVTELANEGMDTVESSITYTLGANVEHLTLTGTAAINGTGNALDNVLVGNGADNRLTGGAGDDTLNGGAGADTLIGGTGNDTYVVDNRGDVVTELANEGIDTVQSSVSYALGSNVENLILTGTANINGTGSSAHNILIGNSGNNRLDAGSGNDVLDGGAGDDTLLGGSGHDQLLGGAGDDVLKGGSGNDVLDGGDGDDVLDGGSGDDVLLGGAGNDLLSGGSGSDQVTGGPGDDMLTGGSGNDRYTFSRGDGQDTIIESDPFPGNQDRAVFGATVNPLDLVIARHANDLRLAIHGSTDQITVQNWYLSSSNRIETIEAGNGQTLLSTQVDQLIQAMASFTQQSGLSWDQAIDQRPQDVQTVLAASWQ